MSVVTDILVLGATGYTGRLIVRYLFDHPQRSSFTFGIAARSKSKLDALIKELGLDHTVHIVEVDVTNFDQVEAAIKTTRVVINAVGPYWRWGTPVVQACVKHGRHYVDLSGETHWISDIISRFDYPATKKGAIIIPSSGFDSIPSDISAFLSNATVKSTLGLDTSIEQSMTAIKVMGQISGGTLATAISSAEEVPPAKLAASKDQYILSPVKGRLQGQKMFYRLTPHLPPIHGAFFVMSISNRSIVHRTWGLHQLEAQRTESTAGSGSATSGLLSPEQAKRLSYGPRFTYDEFFVTNSVFLSLLINIGTAFIGFCLMTSPIRWLVKKFGLQPGEGPSEKRLKKGYMEITNITTTSTTPESPKAHHIKSVMRGKGDPGYYLTSIMIAESALSIVLSHDALPELGRRGGVLTPMSALGDVLIERLKATGKFEFESELMDS